MKDSDDNSEDFSSMIYSKQQKLQLANSLA